METITRIENEALLRQAVEHIEQDPTSWDQANWVTHNCKTRFCLAGWVVVLAGLVNEDGVPTPKGHDFTAQHGLMRPYVDFWSEGTLDKPAKPRWEYPYASAAYILLGIERGPRGYGTHPIFDQYAAKPLSDSQLCADGCCELDRVQVEPDSVEELKKTITLHTGIVFE